ncbi:MULTISPECIES: L-histidine N(alpha)-methyltransferase [Gordonia]|uniref:Histidine-specific methyltransferase SAM-dependent domain-containing protein n=1 Tax=Gordonia alkanivorans NBRC 16433 TaxID=1027371 RepID=F9VQ44_9ACTN|nr:MULTISPECIES: L-histidine N(alpha)-methyltransferase [Gordonia]AZZ80043.1 L-histidine N(alpha)-methyltransferase [Gordonia alkanivorans]MDH3007185.1 L-histidine N(alpha)-methyltransferase [Gordonia alkanivorans]MDH3017012.1 L-histidine N(alpha)-methyltransferase [Gordonia alkanivorans]MDH3022247.1 L-histidine N(alpha)-methyltransferase [Gordonia alkanivorans]MDH3026088.1 L-histidine N(alpha)-methyltransferase [Gordonia alkanivorans]
MTLAADALSGLWQDPPTLPTKWLYDERGSKLFDEITRLPEYYPTRRETAILRARAAEIADATQAQVMVELGSGTSTKTRLLLDAFSAATPDAERFTYVPVDVSTEMLTTTADVLSADYPGIDVVPVVADFTEPDLRLPDADGPRLAVFLGGTIGNFDPDARRAFYQGLAKALSPGDFFLLGTDLVKDTGRLVAAYDDRAGVTADFNRNLIEVLRTGLDARGLYADDFEHIARWNPREHRIEMWLRARRDIDAYFEVLGRAWRLPAGTEIHTEISTKFEPDALRDELESAGLQVVTVWTDPAGDFALTLSRR